MPVTSLVFAPPPGLKRVLAVDPGTTTGLSTFLFQDGSWRLFSWDNVPSEKLLSDGMVQAEKLAHVWDGIVMERPPRTVESSSLQIRVTTLVEEIARLLDIPLVRVGPGEWKPLSEMLRRKWQALPASSRPRNHAKDAYLMALFAIHRGDLDEA